MKAPANKHRHHDAPIVTVFGGTGFLGRYVVWRLARQGFFVRVPTRNPGRVLDLQTDGTVAQIVALPTNIANDASLTRAIEGSDYVVNLIGALFEKGKAQNFEKLHAELPARIAVSAAHHGVKQIVHVSALGADLQAKSIYARTKAEGEVGLRIAFPKAVILRPSALFGAEDNFINQFAKMARTIPVLPLIGGGQNLFQPVYVGDVADAIVKTLRDPHAAGKIYALGGPRRYSFEEILRYILDETKQPRRLFAVPYGVMAMVAFGFEALSRVRLPGLGSLFNPALTRDQIELLKSDNIVPASMPGFADLGMTPSALEVIAPDYLKRYRSGGRFAAFKTT